MPIVVQNGDRFELRNPAAMPNACGFLWNRKMMVQMNCRGYAIAQFMQPEPAKYMHAPNLEAKTFMQPEQPYYAHHPGRFFYIKDEQSGELFSAPFAPVKQPLTQYTFSVGRSDLRWRIEHSDLLVEIVLTLPVDDVVELWQFEIENIGNRPRNLSVYPYFPFGYASWMNQGGEYRADLGAVVASAVTPYQKYQDYFKNKDFKDKTFLLHERTPVAYEVNQATFEGESGLHNPAALAAEQLSNSNALYETPAGVLQYRMTLAPGARQSYRFLLGPAKDDAEIIGIRERYFGAGFETATQAYRAYQERGDAALSLVTPEPHLDAFVNHFLGRQLFYHGDVNRLTTDPQTRNYIQDNMGMCYIDPEVTRGSFLHALAQQEASGAMPDGILLIEGTELKYINQIPHTDHCVWLPVCLTAYLDETDDYAMLDEAVVDANGHCATVFNRITQAMHWLLQARDHRGLSYISQGDWCDPMNMVGYKGRGVSGWLTIATAYAIKLWADICAHRGEARLADEFRGHYAELKGAINQYLWHEHWYARGITDDDVTFGVAHDREGRIFLNPQSWSILAQVCDAEQRERLLQSVDEQLVTPYGPMMLAPAFTAMREDVGRVTQKFPGSAENGSVYNHASAFYIYSLYTIGESERAYRLLRAMLPGPEEEDYLRRGQLPVYIPNYYRGAYYQHPRTAGRSSQLFNTGTVAWIYRVLVEQLFGLQGCPEGLSVRPQLPGHWREAKVERRFRGATFKVTYRRSESESCVKVDGERLAGRVIAHPESGRVYQVEVAIADA